MAGVLCERRVGLLDDVDTGDSSLSCVVGKDVDMRKVNGCELNKVRENIGCAEKRNREIEP